MKLNMDVFFVYIFYIYNIANVLIFLIVNARKISLHQFQHISCHNPALISVQSMSYSLCSCRTSHLFHLSACNPVNLFISLTLDLRCHSCQFLYITLCCSDFATLLGNYCEIIKHSLLEFALGSWNLFSAWAHGLL